MLLSKGDSRMAHSLLISSLHYMEASGILIQSLTDS